MGYMCNIWLVGYKAWIELGYSFGKMGLGEFGWVFEWIVAWYS